MEALQSELAEVERLRQRILQLDDEAHQIIASPIRTPTPRPKNSTAFEPLAWVGTLGLGAITVDALCEMKPDEVDEREFFESLSKEDVERMLQPGSLIIQRYTASIWRGLCDLRAGAMPASATTPKEVALVRAKSKTMMRRAEAEAQAIVAEAEAKARMVQGGSHDASSHGDSGTGQQGSKWRSLRLRLKVQSAFKSATAAHERSHAVDEADFERTGQPMLQPPPGGGTAAEMAAKLPMADSAVVLGQAKPRLQKLLMPVVLQLRVARRFQAAVSSEEESGAASEAGTDGEVEPGVLHASSDEIMDEIPDGQTELQKASVSAVPSTCSLPSELKSLLAMATAKWALHCELAPADSPTPELVAQLRALIPKPLRSQLASGNATASPTTAAAVDGDSELDPIEVLLTEMGEWGAVTTFAELQTAATSAAALGVPGGPGAEMAAEAAPYVAAVVRAKRDVVDGNVPAISNLLEGMWSEMMKDGQEEIEGAGMKRRTVLKFRAQHIHRMITAAMENVASQLQGGMEVALTPPGSAGLPPSTSKLAVRELCAAALVAFRLGFDRPWQLSAIEEDLERRCKLPPELELARKAVEDASAHPKGATSASLGQLGIAEPIAQCWAGTAEPIAPSDPPAIALLGLLLGSKVLPLDAEAGAFLQTAVAEYLDPFIDGEAQLHDREQLRTRTFMARLDDKWAAHEQHRRQHAPVPRPSPVSADCACAAYAAHSIGKLNAIFGFSAHSPGLGRSPVSSYEQMRHLMQLGPAILAALERDFPPLENGQTASPPHKLGDAWRAISAEELTAVAQTHLDAMHGYHSGLEEALAKANREGEDNRRMERLAIWGYA